MTSEGAIGFGTVFEIAKTPTGYASAPSTLVSFNPTEGGEPYGSLIADAKGDLFGTLNVGVGLGTVFEIVNNGTAAAPSYASTPTTLVSFNGTDGQYVFNGLIADAKGDLFGSTEEGGAYGGGTVFEVVNNGTAAAPSYASTPTTLVSFNGADGSLPYGNLIADAKGDLFGTTEEGGAYGYGTVFEVVNNGTAAAPSYASTPTTLLSFNGANGAYPTGTLIADAKGDLFGTTDGELNGNGSTAFEITGSGFVLPPTVVADTAHVSLGGIVAANAANGVLANDIDPIPNDTLIVSAVDGLASDVGQAIVGSYGTLTLNADGSYSYVADQSVPSNIIAQDIFTYMASDGAGGSATSTLTITVTQPGQTYIAGTPGEALTSGNGSVLLDGSLLQNETISAGNGNDGVIAGSNDTITLGNGIDVVKAGDIETLKLGNGADTVMAGANSIVTVGNGNDTVTVGANSTVTLGNGADTVMAISSLINGGNGLDSFVFTGSFGLDTITNFGPQHDNIVLAQAMFANFAAVQSDMTQVGANTVITYDPANVITLTGVKTSSLLASDFHFV